MITDILYRLTVLTQNGISTVIVSLFKRLKIARRSPNYKRRSRDVGHAPFDLLLHIFGVTGLAFNPHTKFEVSSFIRSRYMAGVPKL